MTKNRIEKSFIVIDGDLRLLIELEAGWYTASSLDIRGLNTQGKTIEEAIKNAHDAAKVLAKDRDAMLREIAAASKKIKRASAPKRTRRNVPVEA